MIDLSLLEDFIGGAGESLDEMETALLALETQPNNNELLHTIFRAMHTIKGAAQFVGLEKVSALSHIAEDLLDELREGKKSISPIIIDLLIQTKDRVSQLVTDLEKTKTERTEVHDLIDSIKQQFVEQSSEEDIDLAAFLAEDLPEPAPIHDTETVDADISIPDEEHDQELFDIYLKQLQEKVSVLDDIAAQLAHTQQKFELINAAISALDSLKFSANYMGYDQLTQFYSHWLEELLEAQETNAADCSFMSVYLDKLRRVFPQLTKAVATQHIEPLLELDAPNPDSFAFLTDFLVDAPAPNTVSVQATEPEAALNLSDEEDELFAKLSHALDFSIEKAITSEPINEVFSAVLAANKVQKTEPEKIPPLVIKTLEQANQEPEPVVEAQAEKTPAKTDKVMVTDKALKKSIRVDADKIDALMNQVGELIVDRAYFFQLANEINDLQRYLKEVTGLAQKDLKPVRTFAYRFSEAIISLGRTSNELQEGVMKVRMLPISQLFNRYPRLVHDLAHSNNKKVQLEIRGEETELDKMIIEEISDPLIHMIRNAIGHGIETPEERVKAGKPETGTLILEAYHESNHIVIEVTDDGKGIDTDKIKIKAQEMNLISPDELNRLSSDDLIRFVMLPGFSTAKQIDSTSGRGVGMDVVKKNIEKLNGTIEVESKQGYETKIRLKIPLTLAIIQALLVKVSDDSFTIPLANVEETLRVAQHEISIVEDTEVMYLRGKTLPIFRLTTLFSLKSSHKISENFFVVVVNTGNQKVGLMVDALLGQEEVVIKPLVDYLHEQNCFSGATIIGDGRISLILDVYELINMATAGQVKKHQEQERRSLAALEGSA